MNFQENAKGIIKDTEKRFKEAKRIINWEAKFKELSRLSTQLLSQKMILTPLTYGSQKSREGVYLYEMFDKLYQEVSSERQSMVNN
jgi:hypothetical protein